MAKKKTDWEMALKHRYRVVSGGDIVPGVTSILGIYEKPALVWKASEIGAATAFANAGRVKTIAKNHRKWLVTGRPDQKKRTLAQEGTDYDVFLHYCRGEHRRVWDAKADRGTRVHEIAERWAKGEQDVPVLPSDDQYVDALERFYLTFKPKALLAECIVLNGELLYGGRFDEIAELDGPQWSGTFKLDWKTGDKWDYENALQSVAYEDAELACYNEGGILIGTKPQPECDGSLTVCLRGDGTFGVYDPFAIITREQARTAFRASRELFEARKVIEKALNEGDADGE